jgi:cyclopropane-fatty-acyl-phospholipid synthase
MKTRDVKLLIVYKVIAFDGSKEIYDKVMFDVHAPDALKMLEAEATHEELRILGAFQYVYR